MSSPPPIPEPARTQALDTLRECTREIALYNNPDNPQEFKQLIDSLHKKATALHTLHQHPQEEACLEKIVKLARRGLPEHNLSLPKALETLAGLRARAGNEASAVKLYQEAIELRLAAGLPEAHPTITSAYKSLGDAYKDLQELDQAVEVYGKVLTLRKSLLPEGEKKIDVGVAEALNEVGTVYHMMGEYQTAIPFLKEALEMKQALQGVARERKAARRKEKEEEGEVKDENVVGEEEEEEEDDDEEEEAAEQILQTMYDLASTYAKNAEYTLAQPLYTDLITHRRNESPPNYIKLARALTNAGAMHMEAGDAELALPFYDEALDIFRMVFSEGHPEIAQAMGNLAEVYRRMEKNEEALQLFKMSLAMQRSRGGGVGCCTKGSRCQHAPDPMGMAGILNNCAVLYRAMDDYPEAEKHMEEAILWVKKAVPAGHPYISSMENSLRVVKREGEEKRNGTYDPANYFEKSLHSGGGQGVSERNAAEPVEFVM